ncbi:fatty acyl-CoA reductase 3-like [Solanum stenotomum]|uniref:fatty acyl-CoA reductase 3-like n=1 Tax=Solanum stenotomum TaxID=172797 RepID=UPI0020D0A822|nr:fatty acyl-CoA reductase 3-like [Solanum stenotomum]
MESRTIEQFQGKTILITGATGFLSKLFVEKILRIQPNVKKLYLLIRASDYNSARKRLTNEVMISELFNIIREKMGSVYFCSLVEEKVFAISGDISQEDMGIINSQLRNEMYNEIDIIINSASTFDERYDIAMNVNVVGAMNVLKFAKNCTKVKMLLHVSTAYVCSKTTEIVREKPLVMGETFNENSYLDMDVERSVIANKLKELETQNKTPKEVTTTMKELGIQRAKLHGWLYTYSFTKAMGEMILGHLKENLQLVFIRPTIITSTYKEPFPGWIEGVRTLDAFILAYGKGVLNFFYGNPDSKLDTIPGDLVVNAIFAAILAHENNQCSQHVLIYHISSSSRGPPRNSDIKHFMFHYFTKNPWINKDGKTIKVTKPILFSNISSFRRHISIHYSLLLKMLKFVNLVSFHRFDKTYENMKMKMCKAIRLSELYEPYMFFYESFDDVNTEKLRMTVKEINLDEVLNFDPRCINWEDYFMNTHIPGSVRYLF